MRPHNVAKPPRYGELPPGTAGVIEWHATNLHRVARGLCEVSDLVAVGTARAMAEVGYYDASRGTTLKTWCGNQASYAMRNYLYKLQWAPSWKVKENKRKGLPNPQLRPISQFSRYDRDDEDGGPAFEAVSPSNELEIDAVDSFEDLRAKTMGMLRGRELEVAERRWLGGATLQELADRWCVSVERARQIEVKARNRILNLIPTREALTEVRCPYMVMPRKPVNEPISPPGAEPISRDEQIMRAMEDFLRARPMQHGADESAFVFVRRRIPDAQRADITRLKYVQSRFQSLRSGHIALAGVQIDGMAKTQRATPPIDVHGIEKVSIEDLITKLKEQHALLLLDRDAIDRHAERISRMIAAAGDPAKSSAASSRPVASVNGGPA